MNANSKEVVQLTAWAAILGGIFAYLNVGFMLVVTQGDMNLSLQGAYMLTASAQVREFFRWSMLADVLGFYLPLLIIGGYFWASFRDRAGALGDMAVLAIVVYVILGVAGASLQLAVLNPLASLHAEGGDAAKAAAEAAAAEEARLAAQAAEQELTCSPTQLLHRGLNFGWRQALFFRRLRAEMCRRPAGRDNSEHRRITQLEAGVGAGFGREDQRDRAGQREGLQGRRIAPTRVPAPEERRHDPSADGRRRRTRHLHIQPE